MLLEPSILRNPTLRSDIVTLVVRYPVTFVAEFSQGVSGVFGSLRLSPWMDRCAPQQQTSQARPYARHLPGSTVLLSERLAFSNQFLSASPLRLQGAPSRSAIYYRQL